MAQEELPTIVLEKPEFEQPPIQIVTTGLAGKPIIVTFFSFDGEATPYMTATANYLALSHHNVLIVDAHLDGYNIALMHALRVQNAAMNGSTLADILHGSNELKPYRISERVSFMRAHSKGVAVQEENFEDAEARFRYLRETLKSEYLITLIDCPCNVRSLTEKHILTSVPDFVVTVDALKYPQMPAYHCLGEVSVREKWASCRPELLVIPIHDYNPERLAQVLIGCTS